MSYEKFKSNFSNEGIRYWCLKEVEKQNGYGGYKKAFTEINGDLSRQYTQKMKISAFYELKLRNQHCFQALFTEKAIRKLYKETGGYAGRSILGIQPETT